jgi:hypothetical protein
MTTREELETRLFKQIYVGKQYHWGHRIIRPIKVNMIKVFLFEYYLYAEMHKPEQYVMEISFYNKNKELIDDVCIYPAYLKYLFESGINIKYLQDLAYVTIEFVWTSDVFNNSFISSFENRGPEVMIMIDKADTLREFMDESRYELEAFNDRYRRAKKQKLQS